MDSAMQNTSGMSEKEVLTDLLSSQKFITGAYNTFCCEAAEPSVKNCLMSMLEDEHRIQQELFQTMSQKGFYQTEKAEENKIQQAKQQFLKN